MGGGLSKEQNALPFAYGYLVPPGLVPPGEEESWARLSVAEGLSWRPSGGALGTLGGVGEDGGVIGSEDGMVSARGERRPSEARPPWARSVSDFVSSLSDAEASRSRDRFADNEWEQWAAGTPDRADEDALRSQNLRAITFGQLTPLTHIRLCSQSIARLSANIGLLFNTTTLQLCCNDLAEIPAEIGYMKNLTSLVVSRNKLTTLPDTIGYLTKLVELKASHNQISFLPSSIGTLRKLTTLSLEQNQLTSLPPELGQVKSLVSLDVSDNPIPMIPSEVGRLKFLRRLRVENCPLLTEFVVEPTNSPPSLKELAARVIVRQQLPILEITQEDVKSYLASAHACSFCGGPYFDHYTSRGKMVERTSEGPKVPMEYRLCVPHWNTDDERVALMFCPLPGTAPSPIPSPIASPAPSPPGSPGLGGRRRKTSMPAGGNGAVTLPLSALSKSPSLPSLPQAAAVEGRGLKKRLLEKGMRPSRSLTFT
ncbi:Leucine-rich repeat-containing protein 63 [Borealophlyctis nickersoniae]|nr:Leucine-rich repeat-containing protein 63 [Borealophlyctis nickersoniae]